MNLTYRILDCDIFESYMALEGWDNFPLLKEYTESGEFSFLLKDSKFIVFDFMPSTDFIKAVCIYDVIGDTLSIKLFEVNKKFRSMGIGTRALERLLLECGVKKVILDAKDDNAEKFWEAMGMEKIDNQTYCFK